MATWLVPRNELTPDQIRATEMSPEEHRVILGGPGSGKTQILLHRARYLADRWNVPSDRYHVFVFTKVLKEYIQSALGLLDIPEDRVSNLDQWCSALYREKIGGRLPWDGLRKKPDFDAIRKAVFQWVRESGKALYDFILIDEGQDLDEETFEMFKLLAKHVTVCMDHKQQIYEKGSSEARILKSLGLRKSNISLLNAYRCNPYVARLAARFINEEDERERYLRQVRTEQAERTTPLYYIALNFEDERERLIETLRVRLALGEKVGILFFQKRQVHGFAEGLRAAGFEVETGEELNFESQAPKILTYHQAKGLTFDSVLLPRLVPKTFPTMSEERISHLLFVAITRATKWVYMSTTQEKDFLVRDRIRPLEDEGVVTVRFADLPLFSMKPDKPEEKNSEGLSGGDQDLLDLL